MKSNSLIINLNTKNFLQEIIIFLNTIKRLNFIIQVLSNTFNIFI